MSIRFPLTVLTLVVALSAVSGYAGLPVGTPTPVRPSLYPKVQKIFNANCIGCHGEHGRDEVDLRSYASVTANRADGKLIKKGDPEGSLLIQVLKASHGHRIMPPRSKGIPAADIAVVASWIKTGAKPK